MNFAGTIYNDPDAVLELPPHELKRRYMLQDVYKAYVSIRTVLGGQRCQKMPLTKVKAALSDRLEVEKIMLALPHYDAESIQKIVEIAENHIPMVK